MPLLKSHLSNLFNHTQVSSLKTVTRENLVTSSNLCVLMGMLQSLNMDQENNSLMLWVYNECRSVQSDLWGKVNFLNTLDHF